MKFLHSLRVLLPKSAPGVRWRGLPVRKCLRDRRTQRRARTHTLRGPERVEHVSNKLQRADSCALPTPPGQCAVRSETHVRATHASAARPASLDAGT